MKFLKKFAAALLLVCALALFAACADPGAEQPTPKTVDYTVNIVCEDAGIPDGLQVQMVAADGTVAATGTFTQNTAHFSLPAAIYTVRVTPLPDFEDILDGYVCSTETVTAAVTTATVTVSPEGEETIVYTVTVLMPDGTPAQGIKVQLCGGPSDVCVLSDEATDAQGKVSMSLAPGTYDVHVVETFWPEGCSFDNENPLFRVTEEAREVTVSFLTAN